MKGWCSTPVAASRKSASSSAPSAVVIVPARPGELGVERPRCSSEGVGRDRTARRRREDSAGSRRRVRRDPVQSGLRCKPELVQLRRHIAGEAGIAVPVPHPADVRTLLQNREVVETGALQRHRGGDACNARPDDDNPRLAVSSARLLSLGRDRLLIGGTHVVLDRRQRPAVADQPAAQPHRRFWHGRIHQIPARQVPGDGDLGAPAGGRCRRSRARRPRRRRSACRVPAAHPTQAGSAPRSAAPW